MRIPLLIILWALSMQAAFADNKATPGINTKEAIVAPGVVINSANECQQQSDFLYDMALGAPSDLFALKKANGYLANFITTCRQQPYKCPKDTLDFVSTFYPKAIKSLKKYITSNSNNMTTKMSLAKILCHIVHIAKNLNIKIPPTK